MKTTRYTITQAVNEVAAALRGSSDHSATTIRCAINDTLDAADKDGYAVNHEYSQPRAVARVKSLLRG